MSKQTLSFEQYLASLPPERSREVGRVWQIVRENMPDGYVEQIDSKLLSFKADEEWYVALANQKNYISLHLMPIYYFPEMKAKLEGSGKNLKCGKGCINFKRAEELPLEVLGEIIGANEGKAYKERVQQLKSEYKRKREASKEKKARS